jgi:hypothetical protein
MTDLTDLFSVFSKKFKPMTDEERTLIEFNYERAKQRYLEKARDAQQLLKDNGIVPVDQGGGNYDRRK